MKDQTEKKKKIKEAPIFYAVNYILLTIIALGCLVPFFNVVAKAFSTYGKTVIILPRDFTWFNFQQVFGDVAYFRAFGVSVGVTLSGTLFSVGFMLMAAYPLSKKDLPFRKGIMIFFMIVMLFSGGIVPNFFVMKILGLLNTPFALVLPSLVQVYNLILLKNALEGVPAELEESARIDGAGNAHILAGILMPVLLPAISSVALFTAVTYWNNYFNALLYLINAENYYPLSMFILNKINSVPDILGDQQLYHQKTYIEAAMIIVSILPIVCAYPFVQKFFVRGLTVGSVKG